ncbi:hypothetical protein ACJMK2_031551 [Sinanodonta woodiana]|uniref:Mitochondria-eating protein n=1 Tax=Sinanodonta woodiana TaxID=1069815 RepID=A0ABD3WZ47_SINWO
MISYTREELDLLKKIRSEEKRKYEEDLERNREQIKYLEDDINDLLNRMCSEASERLDHDNPIITDLSDQSKPTQISERYLELYVNQWIDAFHLLQTNHHLSNTKAIEVLLDVLSVSFNECKEARKLGEDAVKALKRYIGEDEDSEDVTILEVMKALKDNKRNIKKMQETFNQHVHSKLATEKNYKDMLPGIRPYINECVDICLLMNIQEPPLELRGLELLSGSTFDSTAFQSYIESGNKIKYIVWPAMYLYQNGPLLRKGIAQGMRDSSNDKTLNMNRSSARRNVNREISLHLSRNKTEKSKIEIGDSDNSPHIDLTKQSTRKTPNHSTYSESPEKIEKETPNCKYNSNNS